MRQGGTSLLEFFSNHAFCNGIVDSREFELATCGLRVVVKCVVLWGGACVGPPCLFVDDPESTPRFAAMSELPTLGVC